LRPPPAKPGGGSRAGRTSRPSAAARGSPSDQRPLPVPQAIAHFRRVIPLSPATSGEYPAQPGEGVSRPSGEYPAQPGEGVPATSGGSRAAGGGGVPRTVGGVPAAAGGGGGGRTPRPSGMLSPIAPAADQPQFHSERRERPLSEAAEEQAHLIGGVVHQPGRHECREGEARVNDRGRQLRGGQRQQQRPSAATAEGQREQRGRHAVVAGQLPADVVEAVGLSPQQRWG